MLLALDTSSQMIGVALYDGTQVLSESLWTSQNYHTVELAPAVADMLAKCGVHAEQLRCVAVALGPGSFTGLRIGLALAKGLVYVHHIPLIGVPTLDFLAAAQPPRQEPMAAVLRAGRGRLAVGYYKWEKKAWQSRLPLQVVTAAELSQQIQAPTLVCGELTGDERRLLKRKRKNVILASPAHSVRRPSFLAELAWDRLQGGSSDDPASLAPIYLHSHTPIPEP
ncbi:MAG: tRNA (adenosine(37)-N6)-threonylcarbamoyltransferase complex dimerization subunit type 1 TsaB [Anaerolineales bacterium]